ncbi:MAG TPA: hypothetical protein VMZ27_02390 [Candidatus Saccharimonadales bacterium]|nr:hypothetical protein [Candidatus Saccharimonadales bacterium]
MKTKLLTALLWTFLTLTTSGRAQSILFADSFESGSLDQWVGKLGLPHHGQIVIDPLDPANHVLTFTDRAVGGDIFNASQISLVGLPQHFVLSFDFLGLAIGGVPPAEYGGFAGITTDPDGNSPHYWLAGTLLDALNVPPTVATVLRPDGQWHHYSVDFTEVVLADNLTSIQLMLEDWGDRLGVPGDVYFDNVKLVAGSATPIADLVPCAGPLSGGKWKNHGQYVSTVVKAVETYLENGILTAEEAEQIVEEAVHSTCGKK